MSKKYVIDIPDDAQYILINGASENHCYTRVEQVDDLEELNSDYINEHFGELQDDAYNKGYAQCQDDYSDALKHAKDTAYKKGLEDAWEAARRIVVDTDHGGLALGTLSEIFGTQSYSYIMRENTAQQAIDKIKAYEDGKHSDRIEVGDEVRTRDGAPNHTFLVTKVTDSHVYGISYDGSWNYWTKDEVTKTGKHYDIASILEAMRNDTSTTRTVKA
jgi:hypothetical protein